MTMYLLKERHRSFGMRMAPGEADNVLSEAQKHKRVSMRLLWVGQNDSVPPEVKERKLWYEACTGRS